MARYFGICAVFSMLLFQGCGGWKSAIVEFEDGFYEKDLMKDGFLLLRPNIYTVIDDEKSFFSDRFGKGVGIEYLLKQTMAEGNEKVSWLESSAGELKDEVKQFKSHVINVNHSQNFDALRSSNIGYGRVNKELFVTNPLIYPSFQNIYSTYGKQLVGVTYAFTSNSGMEFFCFTLVDVIKCKIIYRTFTKCSSFQDYERCMTNIAKDIGV